MNIGMKETIGTVDSRPIRSAPQPHWKTMTSTPYAAPMLSRFSTAAFSGTSTERKTSVSSRNDSSDDGRDEQRQPVLDPVTEVGEGRGLTADVGA